MPCTDVLNREKMAFFTNCLIRFFAVSLSVAMYCYIVHETNFIGFQVHINQSQMCSITAVTLLHGNRSLPVIQAITLYNIKQYQILC